MENTLHNLDILAKALMQEGNAGDVQGIHAFFAALELPLPISGEFLDRSLDNDLLVFLEDFGLCIRIECKNATNRRQSLLPANHLIHNIHVNRPLAHRKTDNFNINVYPLLETLDQPVDTTFMRDPYKIAGQATDCLRDSAIDFNDDDPSNVGLIPISTKIFPQGVPTATDMGAFSHNDREYSPFDPLSGKERSEHSANAILGGNEESDRPTWKADSEANAKSGFDWSKLSADEQKKLHNRAKQPKINLTIQDSVDILYKPLTEAWQRAWPESEPTPDKEKLKLFFALAKNFKNNGLIGWQSQYTNCKSYQAREASRLYLKRRQAQTGLGINL